MSVSPEENSYETMLYGSDGSTRFWIDLSSYHTWWISLSPNIGSIAFYTEMVGGVGFVAYNNAAGAADPLSAVNSLILHSAGSRYPTGMAGFWAVTSDAGNVYLLGCKRGVKPDGA